MGINHEGFRGQSTVIGAQLSRAGMDVSTVGLPVGDGTGTKDDVTQKAALEVAKVKQAYDDALRSVGLLYALNN